MPRMAEIQINAIGGSFFFTILVAAMLLYPKLTKKKLPPIALICISAILGVIVYSI